MTIRAKRIANCRARVGVIAAVIAGCALAANADATTSDEDQAREAERAALDELLGRGTEENTRAERCIRNSSIEVSDVLNGHLIVFTDSRDRIYINQMQVNCPGLKPKAKVAYYTRGNGQICHLDGIRVLMPAGAGLGDNIMLGPSCMLGRFEPITQAQLDVLKERYTPDGKNPLETLLESIF